MKQQILLTSHDLNHDISQLLSDAHYDKLFVLVDEHTQIHCLPKLNACPEIAKAEIITIGAGDVHKNLDTLAYVWTQLGEKGATRHSYLIHLGGGMVTDLGGFAASTFKRGIAYLNIPTTLLSMIDAAVGGKTGINFNGLKNEIGVFSPADAVVLHAPFLNTLDQENIFSGYAEMLKHGLISTTAHWQELLRFDGFTIDYTQLQQLISTSVSIKENIVKKDPYEQGIRKALNLGHTFGHAFESFAMQQNRPVLHGYAVAWGLICELYLSVVKVQLDLSILRQAVHFIKEYYGEFNYSCDDYESLYQFMKHDKKNKGGIINFTLVKSIGNVALNQTATKEEIFETFDFLRDG
jgi:3-dehydroquinate synthase